MHWKFSRLSRAVILAVLPACCAIAPSFAGQGAGRELAPSAAEPAPKLFHGVGVVTSVDAKSGLIAINHEAIPGLMDAMEMEYTGVTRRSENPSGR
jgi:Cu/Ag efflux protein CusF